MDPLRDQPDGPSLLTKVVVVGIGVLIALTVLGWIIGAVLSALRFVVLVGVCIAVIAAIVSSKSR